MSLPSPEVEPNRRHSAEPSGPDLARAIERSLRTPVDALRASLKAIADGAGGDALRSGWVEELGRVAKSLTALIEYAEPPEPMPLRCSAEEIAGAARDALPTEVRDRVWLARDDERQELYADAPLVVKCLLRLLENAAEAGSYATLLRVHADGETATFTVVSRGSRGRFDLGWALEPFHTNKANHIGLGLTLARRDVEVLGGVLELEQTERGDTRATVRLPVRGVQQKEAA